MQVHHVEDPLLIAKQLSNNNFDFGMDSHDMRVVAVICLVIFIILGVRPIIVLSEIQLVPDWRRTYVDVELQRDSSIRDEIARDFASLNHKEAAWWDDPAAAAEHQR